MKWKEHISSDPAIMFGKTVIKGTRIPVELILEKLASGYSFDNLKEGLNEIPYRSRPKAWIFRIAIQLRQLGLFSFFCIGK